MTTHHSRSRTIGAGLVLLTLLASLLITTHIVSVTHAAIHVPLTAYSTYPLSTVGKLFITYPSGVDECTGTALISLNESVVDTAAHCFYNSQTGERAQAHNIQFCPQYQNGESPKGCWIGKTFFVSPDYTWKAGFTTITSDYGLLVVSPLNGRTLQSVVNGVPAISSTDSSHPVTVYGYPDSPYTGKELYSATGDTIPTKAQNGETILRIIDSTLKQGASGGPWFFTYAGTPHLIGHTTSGASTRISSPTLGSAWSLLFKKAEVA